MLLNRSLWPVGNWSDHPGRELRDTCDHWRNGDDVTLINYWLDNEANRQNIKVADTQEKFGFLFRQQAYRRIPVWTAAAFLHCRSKRLKHWLRGRRNAVIYSCVNTNRIARRCLQWSASIKIIGKLNLIEISSSLNSLLFTPCQIRHFVVVHHTPVKR